MSLRVLFFVFLLSTLMADIPATMEYQGRLTDVSGIGITDTLNMVFEIYTVETAGVPIWGEDHMGADAVIVHKGLFNVTLGESVPLNIPFDETYWLQINIGGDVLTPRQRLSSEAYAFRARVADSVVGGGSGDNWGGQVIVHSSDLGGDGTALDPLVISRQGASDGQVLKWSTIAGRWIPDDDLTATGGTGDDWGTQVVEHNATLSGDGTAGNTLRIAQQGASTGQVLKWNGATWTPGADNTGTGTGGDSPWEFIVNDIADTSLFIHKWGLGRFGNALIGNAGSTHVNLGYACTTGVVGRHDKYVTITGGLNNRAEGNYSVISGGLGNYTGDSLCFIGGGLSNYIDNKFSMIGTGIANVVNGEQSAVLAGISNVTFGDNSVVGSGVANFAGGDYSFIGSGISNMVDDSMSVVLTGAHNFVHGKFSTILGGGSLTPGDSNSVSGDLSTIVNGRYNTITGNRSIIGNGSVNYIHSDYSVIAGGSMNSIMAPNSGILAGMTNGIEGTHSVIGGGNANNADAQSSGILAGQMNTVDTRGWLSVIAGGFNNYMSDTACFIGSGNNNRITGSYSSIVGGGSAFFADSNTIHADHAFIGGGSNNYIYSDYGVIPGGYGNRVSGFSSIAMGTHAYANHDSSFVYHDGSLDTLASIDSKTFNVCAKNGARFSADNSNYGVWIYAVGHGDGLRVNTYTNRGYGAPWGTIYAANTGNTNAIYCESTEGYAAYLNGDVFIDGNISKSSGSFTIDHPLDPANKFLNHSFVESPDMKNIYDGVVTLDEEGRATIELPEWFDELNRDFRYQLTCIEGYAPVYIESKIENNSFSIAGGYAGLEVSWMVTGIRKDPYAEANRIVVEEEKTGYQKGRYIHPELYGQPEELGFGWSGDK